MIYTIARIQSIAYTPGVNGKGRKMGGPEMGGKSWGAQVLGADCQEQTLAAKQQNLTPKVHAKAAKLKGIYSTQLMSGEEKKKKKKVCYSCILF